MLFSCAPLCLVNAWLSPDIFDAAMVVLAMYALSIFHPGYLLGRKPESPDIEMEKAHLASLKDSMEGHSEIRPAESTYRDSDAQ